MSTPVRQKASHLAIVSLVSGILGWTIVPWVGSIIAIITGHLARAEFRRAPDRLEGSGRALAGLMLGYSMLALTALALVLVSLFLRDLNLGTHG